MNTSLNSPIPAARSLSGEGTVIGVVSAVALLMKKLLSAKATKPEPVGRADFYAELAVLKDHIRDAYGGQCQRPDRAECRTHRGGVRAAGASDLGRGSPALSRDDESDG